MSRALELWLRLCLATLVVLGARCLRAEAEAAERLGRPPLRFEANRGQADPQVAFLLRGSGFTLRLTPREAVWTLQGVRSPRVRVASEVRMRFVGANPEPLLEGVETLPGKTHYLIGNEPEQWHTHIPSYARVAYRSLYPGVDLVFYGNGDRLEYDFVLEPGTDPSAIRLAFEGADALEVDDEHNLLIHTAAGRLLKQAPLVYQPQDGSRRPVVTHYRLGRDQQVTFSVPDHDSDLPLVIDPVVAFSTYFGGLRESEDFALSVATDAAGDVYVAGATCHEAPCWMEGNRGDAYVAKLTAAGELEYLTYLGGHKMEDAWSIAVDAEGQAVVTGTTQSRDFPRVNAYKSELWDAQDAYVAKLDATGASLVFSTLLGGGDSDWGNGVEVDASGNVYVTGGTYSLDFPSIAAFQRRLVWGSDGFVTKFDASGVPVFSTYFGGDGDDYGWSVAPDASGNIVVAGGTRSSDLFMLDAYQAAPAGRRDVFVARFDPAGSSLIHSTYLGGSDNDYIGGMALDAEGSIYLTGTTSSPDFPTPGAFQGALLGETDAFVAKLHGSGSSLVYATYFGGSGVDYAAAVGVDSRRRATVLGGTASPDLPIRKAYQEAYSGGPCDNFVAQLFVGGANLAFSTYLGGGGLDCASDDSGEGSLAIDATDAITVVGSTDSQNFPLVAPYQSSLALGTDAFVTRLCPESAGSLPRMGNSLTVTKSQPALSLGWGDIGAPLYNVHADTAKDGTFLEIVAVGSGLAMEVLPGSEPLLFYRVVGANDCGEGPQ